MQTPSAEALLHVWELGAGAGTQERGSLLLQAAHPEAIMRCWSDVSLGWRNEALLDLRAVLFGAALDGVADCPGCDETIEITLELATTTDGAVATSDAILIDARGYEVEARPPTAADVGALTTDDHDEAVGQLLARCVQAVRRDGHAVPVEAVPAEVLADVADAMAAHDPYGVVQLAATCPSCGAPSTFGLEPASYLWSELHRWALVTLRDVAELASAFGWSEADILAMSPHRRRAYLDMVPA